ncbi:uncharacterized protein [Anabrus simplex]|uniref:uncharacterized protein n=1 Tax=Anabrus simplex TaxID=316456 RepID=UPI0035A384FB
MDSEREDNLSSKRQRTPNYNEYERNLFVDLIAKYASIIENKRTDCVSVKEKDIAWDRLCREFNSDIRVTKRCTKQLKQFYVNMKRNAKKEKARVKIETYKTGGGTFPKGMNDCSEKLLAIMGDRVEPLQNPFDGDAEYNGDITVVGLSECHPHDSTTWTEEVITLEETTQEEQNTLDTPKSSRGSKNGKVRSSEYSPAPRQKRTTEAMRCRTNIANLAGASSSLCELEKELIFKKFKKEDELLNIKIEEARIKTENACLKNKLLMKKLGLENL